MPTPPPSRLPYRPALDGVRAIAVLAVLAFHFGAGWLPGGFLGVDVFFALSGFLLTSLLIREHRQTGRIDLWAFWGRRARRLLPALLLLLAVLAGWAAWVASPVSAASLRADAIAALLYVANWWFVTSEAAYTATTDRSVLLHTWSLGVEEQWYLLLPLLLLGMLRWAGRRPLRGLGWALAVIGIVSACLMTMLWSFGAGIERVYYGTDTRLFTLVSGALLALMVERHGLPSRHTADLVGVTGAATLMVVAARVGPLNPWLFSGGLVLVALAASGLVLAAATPGSWTSRVLSWKPLVALGIVSYGIYLWHWPVRVVLPTWPWVAWVALTVGAAVVSYWLVERPVRTASWSALPVTLRAALPAVAISGVAVMLFVATPATPPASTVAAHESDVPAPLRDEVGSRVRVEPPATVEAPAPPPPHLADTGEPQPSPNELHPAGGSLDVAVLGDSVAFSLTWHAPEANLGLRAYGEHVLGCGLTDHPLAFPGGGVLDRPHCQGFVESWPRVLREQPPDAALLVAGAWELHDLRDGDRVLRVGAPEHDAVLRDRWRLALGIATSGGRPAVVTDVPCFDVREPGDPRGETPRIFHLNQLLIPLVEEYPTARLASLSSRLCRDGLGVGGRAARYDGVHFTAAGAADLWPWLDQQLRLAVADARQQR